MADLDEISDVHGLLLPMRQACTPKCPGVHAKAQACTGSFRLLQAQQAPEYSPKPSME